MERRRSPAAATMRAPETAGRSMVKVTGSVTDSPGARLFSLAEGVWNLTPGVGLSHASSVVAERTAPLFRSDGEGHGERYGFAGRETIQSGGGGLELDAWGGALPCEQRGGGTDGAFVPI